MDAHARQGVRRQLAVAARACRSHLCSCVSLGRGEQFWANSGKLTQLHTVL